MRRFAAGVLFAFIIAVTLDAIAVLGDEQLDRVADQFLASASLMQGSSLSLTAPGSPPNQA